MVPVTKTTKSISNLTLKDLSPTKLDQFCQHMVNQLVESVVQCSQLGVHGPTTATTTYFSPNCSLSGLDPVVDLANVIKN